MIVGRALPDDDTLQAIALRPADSVPAGLRVLRRNLVLEGFSHTALDVLLGGCRAVRAGPICEVAPGAPLRVWLGTTLAAAPTLELDGRPVTATAREAFGGETANSCFVYSSDTTTETVQSIHGPKRGYGECAGSSDPTRSIETDCEDPSGADAFYWYAGLNRTVGSPGRWGTGLKSAIIKLHKVATPEMPYACTHSATIADPGDDQQPAND